MSTSYVGFHTTVLWSEHTECNKTYKDVKFDCSHIHIFYMYTYVHSKSAFNNFSFFSDKHRCKLDHSLVEPLTVNNITKEMQIFVYWN